jgi:hypothetical protein
MRYRITPKRILAGLSLWLLFCFMTYGHVALGQWSLVRGLLFGLVACAIAFGLAFTARVDSRPDGSGSALTEDDTPRHVFRNHIAVWALTVLFLLVLFKVLDALHLEWRHYFPNH